MNDQFPVLQRPARDNVEPDPQKAHAADADCPLLLLCLERTRRRRAVYHNRGQMGRVDETKKRSGYL